jgi:hypothetical protein
VRLGFAFRETMRGNYYLLKDPTDERAMNFTLRVVADGLAAFARDPVARVEGTVSLEGFASDVPLRGTLAFRFHGERRLIYDFTFESDAGQLHRFRGQKEISPLALVESMTTLPGTLYEGRSTEVGRATVRFDLRSDLRHLLRSFRVAWGAVG